MKVDERLYNALMNEADNYPRYWYLSFADEAGWRGGVFVVAKGLMSATMLCNILGINPGGEVLGVEVPEGQEPDSKDLFRLITTREELALVTKDEVQSLAEYEEERKEQKEEDA